MGFVDQVRVIRRTLDVGAFGSVVAMTWVSSAVVGHAFFLLLCTFAAAKTNTYSSYGANMVFKLVWLCGHVISLLMTEHKSKAVIDFFLMSGAAGGALLALTAYVLNEVYLNTANLKAIDMWFLGVLAFTVFLVVVVSSPLSLLALTVYMIYEAAAIMRVASEGASWAWYVFITAQFIVDALCYVILSFSFSFFPALQLRLRHKARRNTNNVRTLL